MEHRKRNGNHEDRSSILTVRPPSQSHGSIYGSENPGETRLFALQRIIVPSTVPLSPIMALLTKNKVGISVGIEIDMGAVSSINSIG